VKSVHCLGIMVMDALSGPLPNYPVPRRQVQVVTKHLQFQPGGGAVNTGSALARMGLPVAVFSKLGEDANGAALLRELRALGVDVSGVCVSPRDTTPFTYVGIHPDGDRTFIHTPGANLDFTLADLDLDRLLATDLLLYQDLWVLPGIDGRPGAELLAEARRRGVTTLLDECWGLGPNRGLFETMLPHCDYVIPSEDDMLAIYPGLAPDAIAARILEQGPHTAVLKMGRQGCLVATGSDRIRIPIIDAPVVDTTGAGDCWNAGFIAGLAHGEDVVTAAWLGTACASFCVGAVGGSAGVPTYAAVQERARQARRRP
jgi:sugar/nucleoside kinase (ribokinase family)